MLRRVSQTLRSSEGVATKSILVDNTPTDQVLLDYPLKNYGCTRVVPDPLWIDYRYRPRTAYPQAADFRSVHRGVLPDEVQFNESTLEVFPRLETLLSGATLRLILISTQKDVPLKTVETQSLRPLR